LLKIGAGISTESQIQDYRSPGVGQMANKNYKPWYYQDFIKNAESSSDFWARHFVEWPRLSSMTPNYAHEFLKKLEDDKKLIQVVTQNVNNLQTKAGSKQIK